MLLCNYASIDHLSLDPTFDCLFSNAHRNEIYSFNGPSLFAFLYSGIINIVGGEEMTHGAWYGVGFRPLVKISLICTSSYISLAFYDSLYFIYDFVLDLFGSSDITLAPRNSLSGRSSIKTNAPRCNLEGIPKFHPQ